MRFVLRMAVRETRASWKRLIFFFLCVAIGVGAIAALRSVIQNVRGAMQHQARTLSAADIVIQSNAAWTPSTIATIDGRFAAVPRHVRADAIEMATMVRPEDETKALARMVELEAVDDKFPLYGRLELADGKTYTHALLANRGALVRPELLVQLDVQIGDRLVIGKASFDIRGLITEEPGRSLGLFSLGPRVLIDLADLDDTGLLTFGSRVRYLQRYRVPDPAIASIVADLRAQFRTTYVTVRSYRDTEERVGRGLTEAENFLGLVGYIIVVLGGIGVWSVTRVFVQQKLKSMAVLKCLGASVAQILGIYLAQVLALGALGSGVGLVLAAAALRFVPEQSIGSVDHVRIGLTVDASLQAFGVGLLVSLLFALVPLLEARRVRPLVLLRDDAPAFGVTTASGTTAQRRGQWDWVQILAGGAVAAALVSLASWQAASFRTGLIVSGGFLAVVVILHLVGLLLIRAVRPLARSTWFPVRYACAGFGRPGHQTRVILLAVGLGSFFILGIQLLQTNLLREFALDLRPDAPDLFLIDIQPDQVDGVRALLRGSGSDPSPRLLPVLRARVTGVRGRDVNLASVEQVRQRGMIAREFVITYRNHLEDNERIVDGALWPSTPSSEPEVSIESSIRDRVGIQLGDRVRFDILGREIEARVTSVREVRWEDSRSGGFVFVFRPGALEQAPHTYLGVLRAPRDAAARARLQRDLVATFPNVSAIDVREVLQRLEGVMANVTLGISIVGGVAVFSGLLILIGSVATTKFQRLQEAAVLKTLGASSTTVATLLAIEYGLLGTLAGLVGGSAALAFSWGVTRYVLDIAWAPAPAVSVFGIVLTAVLVGIIGVLASIDVLRRKPLAVLRAG